MGPKTTTTTSGGGAATPVANEFQAWLISQLTGQSNPGGAFMNGMNGTPAPVNSNGMQPRTGTVAGGGSNGLPSSFDQSGSPFTNAFNSMLNGQVIDPSGANSAIAQSIAGGPQTFGQNFGNAYQNQQFNPAAINQLGTNFGAGQTGMADLSGVQQTALSSFNPQAASSGYSSVLSNLLGTGQNMLGQAGTPSAAAGQASIGAGIALDPATVFDMNNPYFAALKQQQERGRQQALADNNARWGAQGAGAIGTGAMMANNDIQSKMDADQTVALQQAVQQLMQQDLAERGTKANVGLTSRGQDANVAIANAGNLTQANIASMQGALQGQNQNNAMFNSLLNGALSGRGQDFQNQQFTAGQGLDQSMFNAGQQNQGRDSMLQALLANQGLGNNFSLSAAGLNNDAMQTNNANSMANANSLNGFNLANAGNVAQYGQAANQLNSQNFQNNQQGWQSMLGLGQGTNQMANQNIQAALAQLFGSLGQSTGLGIEGRNTQVNQQGSPWGSILGAVLPIAGQVVGGAINNRGNSGGTSTGWQTPSGTSYTRPTIS